MMKLLGSVLIAGAALWLGFSAARRLGCRVRALDELAGGLRLLEQELELSEPELGALMERLSHRAGGAGGRLFSTFRDALPRLGEKSAAALWQECVEGSSDLTDEGKRLLCALGDCLGRFDVREQQQCVEAVRARLEQLREREEGQRREKCRMYHALALSGGAFLVVLLI